MKNINFTRTPLAMATGLLLLAACGGGGDGGTAPPPAGGGGPDVVAGTQVPTSATTSSAGAFAFANATASATDNTAEPIEVGAAVLATSETDEPDPSV
jgi:hypothetical protein